LTCPAGLAGFFFLMRALLLISFGLFCVSAGAQDEVEISANLSHGPAGITVTPSGSYIVSLHQYFRPLDRVVEINRKGEVRPFPTDAISRGEAGAAVVLDSVQGLECDSDGVVWMLDNGRRGEVTPKLVGWNTEENELERVYHLPAPATTPTSFLADLAVDPEEPFIYATDPASGRDAALLVLDRRSGACRRVLQGHFSVQPQPGLKLEIDRRVVEALGIDGRTFQPQAGVNPIAIDRKGEWVYFGPLMGRTLYRIRAEHLRDLSLNPIELESRVTGYAEKPICDGISIDSKNNVYVSDLSAKAVGIITAKDRRYSLHCGAPQLDWIDGFCYGTDRHFHGYSSQLHLSGPYNAGKDVSASPYLIFRFRGLSSGEVGR